MTAESRPKRPIHVIPVLEVKLVRSRRPLRLPEECIANSESAARALHALIGLTDREHFACLFTNAANRVTGAHIAAIGGQSASTVDVRAIMRAAFAACASALVLGHNHPSGDPSPSADDLVTTAVIMRVGILVGIPVLDHIIVTADERRYHSMLDRGTLPTLDP